ncbi:alanine/glycine:cation symporter family protein [Propioniciclava soli]|uniref:alanine/glycine:cation symporter family protein n=1 Tax=Propioniciclava soli TaxID=2775081 RepID=UPI001E497D04
MDAFFAELDRINGQVYLYGLVGLLVAVGLWLTIATRGVQVRHFGAMVRSLTRSRAGAQGGISSFQAFAIGMATRIGIGNITGVALALILGGPGAIFWMWVVAAVGMATGFAEATLAQVFKVRAPDGTFRGGPAFYVSVGLRSRGWGVLFAVLLIFAMVVAMPMVQSNTIAVALEAAQGVPTGVTGVVVAALTALVVFGGVRGVARAAELITPLMALAYVAIALAVIVANLTHVPAFLGDILAGAFGLREGLAGLGGGVMAALLNGAQRGLFSNEAGMGTAPNGAATATVAHPVQQGFVQSLGVFIDSMVICTATAFIILSTDASGYVPGVTPREEAASLTTNAVVGQLGAWASWPMLVMIFFFGFSSILGAYAYAQVNLDFLGGPRWSRFVLAAVTVATTGIGAVQALPHVWILMDSAMALITVVNLAGLVALTGWVRAALADHEERVRRGDGAPPDAFSSAVLPDPDAAPAWRGAAA